MLTVTEGFEASGIRSTCRPFSRRYSEIPSIDVTYLAPATSTAEPGVVASAPSTAPHIANRQTPVTAGQNATFRQAISYSVLSAVGPPAHHLPVNMNDEARMPPRSALGGTKE